MLSYTFITALLTAATALALPQPLSERITYTNVTYYQGASTEGSCGHQVVSTGSITTDRCYTAHTYALSIQPLKDRDCQYTLWKVSSDCGTDATVETSTALPAGEHAACVVPAVYDGGEFVRNSGKLTCHVRIHQDPKYPAIHRTFPSIA